MALTLESIDQVKEKARGESRKVGVHESLRSLWKHLQSLGNPDLKIAFFTGLQSADVVVSDAACKVYAIYMIKPTASTVDSWFRGTNHASVASGADLSVYLRGTSGGGRAYCPVFHDGLPMGTGLTVGAHTAVGGTSKSLVADAPSGFVIVGAP